MHTVKINFRPIIHVLSVAPVSCLLSVDAPTIWPIVGGSYFIKPAMFGRPGPLDHFCPAFVFYLWGLKETPDECHAPGVSGEKKLKKLPYNKYIGAEGNTFNKESTPKRGGIELTPNPAKPEPKLHS